MEEKVAECMKFKYNMQTMLEDVRDAAMCVIPMTDNDAKIIKDGINSLNDYIDKLKSADTLRELNKLIDVNKYMENQERVDELLSPERRSNSFNEFMMSLAEVSNDGT